MSSISSFSASIVQQAFSARVSRGVGEESVGLRQAPVEARQNLQLADPLRIDADDRPRQAGPLDSFQALLPPGRSLGALLRERLPADLPGERGASGRPQGDAGLDDSIDGQLKNLSPEAAKAYQALRSLLERLDPEAAEEMDRLVGKTLDYLSGSQPDTAEGGSPMSAQSLTVRRTRVEIAIENTSFEISSRAGEGQIIGRREVQSIYVEQIEITFGASDPLVLDLNGNGLFDTTTAADGHDFDIRGDGSKVRSATATNGDALLAYDRNGNGQIDSGRELFGDQNGRSDGFSELGRLDSNRDGRIDAQDLLFQQLSVFEDRDLNGRTDDGELRSLAEAGITAIRLQASEVQEESSGNRAILASLFERADGSTDRIGDLLFQYQA